MSTPGSTDRATAPPWQIELLDLKRAPETTEEILWFEKNGSNILFDSSEQTRSGRKREIFVEPTHAAMSAKDD